MEISTLFVYGSLMSGFWNHDRFCGDALTIQPAVTTGRLYHLHYGFPAMFDTPDGQVFGEIMTFPDIEKTVRALDYLEGYRSDACSHYLRTIRPVKTLSIGRTATAWVYVYPDERLEKIKRIGEFIPGGCWRTFIELSHTKPFEVSR